MTKNLFTAPVLTMAAMALMSSVAVAGKPDSSGGGKGGNKGGGDTGSSPASLALTAALSGNIGYITCSVTGGGFEPRQYVYLRCAGDATSLTAVWGCQNKTDNTWDVESWSPSSGAFLPPRVRVTANRKGSATATTAPYSLPQDPTGTEALQTQCTNNGGEWRVCSVTAERVTAKWEDASGNMIGTAIPVQDTLYANGCSEAM